MQSLKAVLYLVVLWLLIACSEDGTSADGDIGGGGGVTAFDPSQPGADFTPIADQAAAEATVNRMWQRLTQPLCWDSSFVGDPTVFSTPAGVSQFQFFNPTKYRYVGFSTWTGDIILYAVGYHNGYDTVIVQTWTGDIEALVLVNENTLVQVLKNPSNVSYTSSYGAVEQGCL